MQGLDAFQISQFADISVREQADMIKRVLAPLESIILKGHHVIQSLVTK